VTLDIDDTCDVARLSRSSFWNGHHGER
jgi:hypothetical protein